MCERERDGVKEEDLFFSYIARSTIGGQLGFLVCTGTFIVR